MWMGSQIKLPRSRILKPEKDVPVFMCVCVYSLSGVDCFATPWTIALQAPLFMGPPRREYWSELPFPFPGDRPKPKDRTWVSCTAGGFFTTELPGKPSSLYTPMFMLCTLVIQVSKKKKKNLLMFLLLQSCFFISMLPKTFISSMGSDINSMAMNHKIKSHKHEELISICTQYSLSQNSACVKCGPEFQTHSILAVWNQMA